MSYERKAFADAVIKALPAAPDSGEPQGVAEMIVSVFGNEDAGGDIVEPGFFADSLREQIQTRGRLRAKGVWSHDWDMPVAKTLEARELAPGDALLPDELRTLGGLYIKGQFNLATQRGREAFEDLRFGAIDEFSFGYDVQKSYHDEKGRRHLVKGELLEWSPVLLGMNDRTALIGTKAGSGDGGSHAHTTIRTHVHTHSNGTEHSHPHKHPANDASHDTPEHRAGQSGRADGIPQRTRSQKPGRKYWYNSPFSGGEPLEGSYEDLIEDLGEALNERLAGPFAEYSFASVVATFPDYCIVAVREDYDDAADYWRVPYTLDQDGDPVLGDASEVQPAFVAVSAGTGAAADGGEGEPGENEPADLMAPKGQTILGQASRLLAGAQAFAWRLEAAKIGAGHQAERKEGRVLSAANRGRLTRLLSTLQDVAGELDSLINEAGADLGGGTGGSGNVPQDVGSQTTVDTGKALYAEYQRTIARLNGVAV